MCLHGKNHDYAACLLHFFFLNLCCICLLHFKKNSWYLTWASLVARLSNKESACNAGDPGDIDSIPGLRRSSGGGNDNPLQYPCLENPMERGAWRAADHGVSKSGVQLSTAPHQLTHTRRFFLHTHSDGSVALC